MYKGSQHFQRGLERSCMLLDVFATSCPTNLKIYYPAGWNENTTRAFKKRIMHINYVECKSGCLLHRKKRVFPPFKRRQWLCCCDLHERAQQMLRFLQNARSALNLRILALAIADFGAKNEWMMKRVSLLTLINHLRVLIVVMLSHCKPSFLKVILLLTHDVLKNPQA